MRHTLIAMLAICLALLVAVYVMGYEVGRIACKAVQKASAPLDSAHTTAAAQV